ncbi:MFS transporter [Tellurirhabdus rosea]|uniref:MFS transporter n=1 Tax=Tellurirhabdus rosea TaxID=2674997 RepID=UPI00224EC1AD|nr:MFS transporter [Tellurirhabdus rosea]
MANDSSELSIPLPSKSLRLSRLSISVFFFISGFGFSNWASRIPNIQHQLGLSEAQLGTILFVMPMGMLLMMPLTGYLVNRFSSRVMILVGALVLNALLAVLGFAATGWQLAFVLFFFGSARNMLSISVNAQSVELQNLYDRSIISSFHGIWSIAGFAGAGLGMLMISMGVTPAWHFLIVALALVVAALGMHPYTVHDKPQPPVSHRPAERGSVFVIPDKSLLKFGFMSFSAMAAEGTLYDWSGVYFRKVVQASESLSAAGFTFFMIAMTLGRFSGDWVVNRLGRRNVLKYSGFLMFAGMFLAAAFPHPITACLGFVMVGFGTSNVVPLVIQIATQNSEGPVGSIITGVTTIAYFGFLLVPPIVGYLAEALNLQWSFGMMSLFGLLVVWLVSRVR